MRKMLVFLLSCCLVLPLQAKSYSSGGHSFSSGAGRSSFSSGRSSYSSGSRSYSSGSRGGYSSGGRSYSSGSKSTGAAPSSSGKPLFSFGGSSGGSRKPDSGAGFDASAARAKAMSESKAAFTKAAQPQPAYTDAKGQTRSIDPQDEAVRSLRQNLNRERWADREVRSRSFYAPYSSRPVVFYHDPYGSLFWWWLLDRSLDERAYWAYCHRRDMDQQRYQDLLARDAQLETRIHQLETEQRPVDPAYVPAGVDPDLVYSDEYVHAVYNPQPASGHGKVWVVLIILAGGIAFGVWFVFFKRW